VADGMLAAAATDEARGQVFLLANDGPLTVRELVRAAEVGLDRRILSPSLPAVVGKAGMSLLALGLRMAGRGDLARHAPGTMEMLSRHNPFSAHRAREVLGWNSPADPRHALADAFRWWKRHGAHGAARGGA
jgi:nucleoside-diphosphate-sugar epimerase